MNAPDRPAPYNTAVQGTGRIILKTTCVSSTNPVVENGDTPPCNANIGDQQDVKIQSTLTDVRCVAVSGGCAAAGGQYGGKVLGLMSLRITDRQTGPLENSAGTLTDYPFTWGLQCSSGACNSTTSADAVIPSLVKELKRVSWQVLEVEIFDGGANGNLAAAPSPGSGACPPACMGDDSESVFLRQGLFAP